ncbi:MAG: hypothetical protein ABR585_15895, partial [Gemmatimonadaceae bacterium]
QCIADHGGQTEVVDGPRGEERTAVGERTVRSRRLSQRPPEIDCAAGKTGCGTRDEVVASLEKMRAGDADWRRGKTFSLVYYESDELLALRADLVAALGGSVTGP